MVQYLNIFTLGTQYRLMVCTISIWKFCSHWSMSNCQFFFNTDQQGSIVLCKGTNAATWCRAKGFDRSLETITLKHISCVRSVSSGCNTGKHASTSNIFCTQWMFEVQTGVRIVRMKHFYQEQDGKMEHTNSMVGGRGHKILSSGLLLC